MKRKLLWFALFTAIFIWLGKDAQAQNPRPSAAGSAGCVQVHSSTGNTISCGGSTVVASLPSASANANAIYLVHDGTSSSDCTAGGGTSQSLCVSNGSAWVALGGGGSSLTPCGPTVGEVQLFASSSALGCLDSFVIDLSTGQAQLGSFLSSDAFNTALRLSSDQGAATTLPQRGLDIEVFDDGFNNRGPTGILISIDDIATASGGTYGILSSLTINNGLQLADFWAQDQITGTVPEYFGVHIEPLTISGGTVTTAYNFWGGALGGDGATDGFQVWFDEQGAYVIHAINSFNSVYQARPALYNPQVTKFTPGAVNFERCIPGCQWESNEAWIRNEAGGTGVLRRLGLGSAGLDNSTADVALPFTNVKTSVSAVAPGAGKADMRWLAGTTSGTCKLVSNAGTSATEVTIIDNVGGGC